MMKYKERGDITMMTAELAQKIEMLSNEEYHMVEIYVDNVVEYAKRKKKDAAWEKIKTDLDTSEKRMSVEGGMTSRQLREKLGV